ncbi:MAG: hypothetical protein KatS3mg090_0256 [Patescibacteria group bacterium]|nr:MAG: hypothetical protein KatS3mg090_0256 [Patescibacteria group bacterium]
MQKTGFNRSIAEFSLDYGKCPPYLFERMVKLAKIIVISIIENFSAEELVYRLSDSVWFQSLGSVLAFDWNASGLTTTTLGALKQAISEIGPEQAGIFICGGKGKTSRKTPDEILKYSYQLGLNQAQTDNLIKTSKLTAKIDSSLVQDGFQLYHHNFIFTKKLNWTVIQQGMNTKIKRARRYHWHSKTIKKNFFETPHATIATEIILPNVFNLIDKKTKQHKTDLLTIVNQKKDLFVEIKRIKNIKTGAQLSLLNLSDNDFKHHSIETEHFTKLPTQITKIFEDKRFIKTIETVTDKPNNNLESLVLTKGVGPKTIRALSLLTEIIFGSKPSFTDPVRYTYAFGGKDGIPYPVNKTVYDKIIQIMETAIKKSSISFSDKNKALKRLEQNFAYDKTKTIA